MNWRVMMLGLVAASTAAVAAPHSPRLIQTDIERGEFNPPSRVTLDLETGEFSVLATKPERWRGPIPPPRSGKISKDDLAAIRVAFEKAFARKTIDVPCGDADLIIVNAPPPALSLKRGSKQLDSGKDWIPCRTPEANYLQRMIDRRFGRGNTPRWAAMLLPPDQAANIVASDLIEPVIEQQGPTIARLFSRGREVVPGICRQDIYYGPLVAEKPSDQPWPVVRHGGLAVGSDCLLVLRYAEVQPANASETEAVEALRKLLAERGSDGREDIMCVSEYDSDTCRGDRKKILASMPLNRLSTIEHADGHRWLFTFEASPPGGSQWQVQIWTFPGKQVINMWQRAATPFE